MKRLRTLLAAFASTLALAAAVHAQENLPDQENPPSDVQIETGLPVGPETPWSRLLEIVGTYVDADSGNSNDVAMVSSIADTANVQFVDIAELPGIPAGDESMQELQAVLDENAGELSDLRDAVAGNTFLTGTLTEAGYSATDVVALIGGGEDDFYLYFATPSVPASPEGGPTEEEGLAGPGATGGD